MSGMVLCHQGDRILAPLLGKDHILRRTHAIDHLHVGLRSILRQPATHRHYRRYAAAGGQQQEFIFRFIVAGKLAHRIGQPKVIAAFDLAGQPLRTRALVNTANGQRNVLADPRRGGKGIGAQRFRRVTHADQGILAGAVRIVIVAQQRKGPHVRGFLVNVVNLHPPRALGGWHGHQGLLKRSAAAAYLVPRWSRTADQTSH